MEQLLSGNTWSSSFLLLYLEHRATPVEHYGETAHGSSAVSTYSRADHSVSTYSYSAGAHMDRAAASPEHTDHLCRLCWSTWISNSSLLGAQGAAASPECREQLCWRICICSCGATVSALRQLLLHVLQRSCSLCSRLASAPCAPVDQLYLLPESHYVLHVLQQSCSLCSRLASAPCDPVQQLYLLPESRCSMCSSTAALRSPGKQLLHWSCCIYAH